MFTACSSDDTAPQNAERVPINFTANIQQLIPSAGTRVGADTEGLSITEFPVGAEITVGYYSSGTTDPVLKLNESGTWEYTGNKLYYPLSGSATVLGFYPKLTQSVGGLMHGYYNTPTNQSELASYLSADVIAAAATIANPTSEPVALNFKHLGAKIVVKLSGSSIPSTFTVKMKNIITTGMYTTSSDAVKITKMYGSNSVTFGNYSSSGQTAIIIPQEVAASTALFEVGTGDVTYTYTTDDAITFNAGYEYTFNLTFSQTAINPGDITISGWGADPNESDPIDGNLAQ